MPVPKQEGQPFMPPLPPQSGHLFLVFPRTSRQLQASGFEEELISVIFRVVSMMIPPASSLREALKMSRAKGIADVGFRPILEQQDFGVDITTGPDRKRGETPSLDRPQQALHFCHGRRTVRNPCRC